MTATSAGNSSGCLSAKGLDISLAALKRQDPYINNIMDVASQVALYTYNNRANEWEKTEVEGTLFIYTRLASPRHGFTIMNRLSMENLTEPITKDLDFQLQDPFLLYRNARLIIHGIWFYDKEDCQRIAQRMKNLTQQELVQAQTQGSWPSPAVGGGGGGVGVVVVGAGGGGDSGRGDGDGKAVDIIQMLTKARTEFDKGNSSSEPKEIGGSSVIYGNPNLIKPIPVKPNTQDGEVAEPKPLSLATLFGSQHQHQHQHSPKPVTATSLEDLGSAAGKGTRPPVARTLTYDGTLMTSGRSGIPIGGSAALSGNIEGGSRAVSGKEGRNVAGLLPSASTSSPQQQQQQQHCPAIQKLMQGQRVGGSALQTLSESPENRLCDNGVPLEHHHHHHPHPNQHHHHHHHHHLQQQQQQQQQFHSDPIKRLFQAQSLLPPSSASFTSPAGPCCPNPAPLPPLQQSPHQPTMVDSCLHLQAQQNQQMCFSLTKPQVEAQTSIQSASTLQGAGLLLSQVTNDQVIQPPQGLSSQMIGVVSPHELLQKLQLVQQEQGLVTNESPRLCPGLAPRFLAPAQSQSPGSVVPPAQNQIPANANQKAGLQFQVISPQRIPATVAPSLLLSPSVFSQAKPSSGLSVVAQENCPAPPLLPTAPQHEEAQILSRSQLQATLLHLIQTDSSFLDTIHKAYISCFTPGSGAKYQ